jgi:hypothetical protein
MKILFFALIGLNLLISGCVNKQIRFPASVDEIYTYKELKQNLMMAAQNNILFYISDETIQASEKKEIDSLCRSSEAPFWTEKLSVVLNLFRQRPEWYSKFHVLEMKRSDQAKVTLEKDLDGATVLSIQYVKSENRGQVSFKTNLPCNQNRVVEYLGKEIVHTQYDFPVISNYSALLNQAEDRKKVDRFEFNNQFISYLAERGFILKFSHELSLTRVGNNEFILVKLLNQYSQEIKSVEFVQLWMKIVNKFNEKENIVQFFSFENNKDLKTGVSVLNTDQSKQMSLFSSFKIENNELVVTTLDHLNKCLSAISLDQTSQFMRKPASEMNLNEQDMNQLVCSQGHN